MLFDFAGVMTDDPFGAMGSMAVQSGLEPAEFAAIAIGRGDYGSGDHPWHRLERGEIDLEEFDRATNELARSRGLDGFPPLPVDAILSSVMSVRPEMLSLAGELRAHGIATAIVTNNVRALGAWRELADWDEVFDLVVDSCHVGMRKPEPRIFHHTCDALGVDPAASVFLDDMQANVDGAVAAGLTGFVVSDAAPAIAEVRRLAGI